LPYQSDGGVGHHIKPEERRREGDGPAALPSGAKRFSPKDFHHNKHQQQRRKTNGNVATGESRYRAIMICMTHWTTLPVIFINLTGTSTEIIDLPILVKKSIFTSVIKL